jgi:hypothetical protein
MGIRSPSPDECDAPVPCEYISPPLPLGGGGFFRCATSLTDSNTFRTASGFVTTEIMCRRPWQCGQRGTSSPKTLRRSSAQEMKFWPLDCFAGHSEVSASVAPVALGSFRSTDRGTTKPRSGDAGARTP